jgi:NADH-quinone oxidoreductase subunit C
MSDVTDDAGTDAPAPAPDHEAAEPEAELVHGAPVDRTGPIPVVYATREQLAGIVRTLRDEDDGFNMCLDVTAVDHLVNEARVALPQGVEPERFELVVHLISHARHERLRLRVQVPEDDPTCPSLFDVHPGTEAMEREVYDMFGIRFEGHPDLTRILMPEDWDGHPLRKDHPVGRIPVQFKGSAAPEPSLRGDPR